MKISVALLRQPFQPFFSFFQKFYICVDICCVVASPLFSFFGGRIMMRKNQCCIVASAFSQLFSAFFEKFHICVRKSVLRCCVTPFQLFSPKFYRCVSSSVLHCCIREDSCIRRKLSLFGARMWMCENQCCVVASAFSAFSQLLKKN